jgi:hypothetical protein
VAVGVGATGTTAAAFVVSSVLSVAFLSVDPGVAVGVVATCTCAGVVVAFGWVGAVAVLSLTSVVSVLLLAAVLVVCAFDAAGLADVVDVALVFAGAALLEAVWVGDAGVELLDAVVVCVSDEGAVEFGADCVVGADWVAFWAGVEAVPFAASLRSEL